MPASRIPTQRLAAGLVALCLALASAAADAGPALRLPVSARILPMARVVMLSQAARLDITAADVRRGYVELANASQVTVRANTGYRVMLSTVAGWFERVTVRGLAHDLVLGPGGDSATAAAAAGGGAIALSVRFDLPPDAVPGTYDWPLVLSVMPTA